MSSGIRRILGPRLTAFSALENPARTHVGWVKPLQCQGGKVRERLQAGTGWQHEVPVITPTTIRTSSHVCVPIFLSTPIFNIIPQKNLPWCQDSSDEGMVGRLKLIQQSSAELILRGGCMGKCSGIAGHLCLKGLRRKSVSVNCAEQGSGEEAMGAQMRGTASLARLPVAPSGHHTRYAELHAAAAVGFAYGMAASICKLVFQDYKRPTWKPGNSKVALTPEFVARVG